MKNLSKGSKGKEVSVLQKALNRNGAKPKLTENGDFDGKTLTALKTYQKKTGSLKVDGIYGPNTDFELSGKADKADLEWPLPDYAADVKDYEKGVKEIVKMMADVLQIATNIKREFSRLVKEMDKAEKEIKSDAGKVTKAFGGNISKLQKKIVALEKEFHKTKAARIQAEIVKKVLELEKQIEAAEKSIGDAIKADKYEDAVKLGQEMLNKVRML